MRWLWLMILVWVPLQAQDVKVARAERLQGALRLDGRLDDDPWRRALPIGESLIQWEPNRGAQARLGMAVRVLFDETHVYVGARLPRPKVLGPVMEYLHRRDQDSASEWFEVSFDTLHDRWNAYQFRVNPANVQMDRRLFGPASDPAWDAVWESATHVGEEGWSVELKLPLSLFRLQNHGGPQVWGFHVGRHDPATREIATWTSPPPRGNENPVSAFGHLEGLAGLRPGQTSEWLPYLSTQRKVESTEAWDDRRWKPRAGLDARFRLGAAGEANLTLRPDFGQVEVDQAVVNLSTVETFLPEKRPFFTQGMELFQNEMGWPTFYSRRVGQGLAAPRLGEGERLLERPLASEIQGAGKVTTKLDSGQSLGVLMAATGAAHARVLMPSGQVREERMMPRTSYGVLSFIQPMGSNGDRISTLVTHMNQPGGRMALVGSTEGRAQSADQRLTFHWQVSGSRSGPQAAPVTGWHESAKVTAGLGSVGVLTAHAWNVDRAYDVNDMGYMERADEQGLDLLYRKHWDRPLGPLAQQDLAVQAFHQRDRAGHTLHRLWAARYGFQTQSHWRVGVRMRRWLDVEDDRELRTSRDARKKYLRVEAWSWHALEIDTPTRWPWSLSGTFAHSRLDGGPTREGSLVQNIRPDTRWEIGLESRYRRESGDRGYVATLPGEAPLPGQRPGIPVVGQRSLSQFEQVLRLSYTVSTTFSLQAYAQGLAASWAYRDLQRYGGDGRLLPGLPAGTTEPETRFSSRVLNTNAILRWAFRPGSTAYLVYTHGIWDPTPLNDHGSLRPWGDLASLVHRPSDDVLQLKVSWLIR